jgi:hypothetical protein
MKDFHAFINEAEHMKDFNQFINEAADEGDSFVHIGDIYYRKTMEGVPMFFKVTKFTWMTNISGQRYGKVKVRQMTAKRTEEPYTGPKMSRRWWLYTPDKEYVESTDLTGLVQLGLGGSALIDTEKFGTIRRWDGKPIANQEGDPRRR